MTTPISAGNAPAFQPLPRRETARPLAEFAPRFQAATEPVSASTANQVAPLPAAPLFARQVAREAPRAAPNIPPPAAELTARPMAERGAVPERLTGLLQAERGRAALTARRPLAATAIRPLPEAPQRPLTAQPEPTPAREAPVRLNTLARSPATPALEPAGAPARPRFARMAAVSQEIQQLNARQTFESAVRDRTVKEDGGTGARRVQRTILDQRV